MKGRIVTLVIVGALGLSACDTDDAPAAASSVAAPVAGGPLLPQEGILRALAMVNQPDVVKARPFAERHALIAKVAATADGTRIDRRLNLALDLRQAVDAPDPCATYGDALSRISRTADAYFSPHLRDAAPPRACADLPERRNAVLATLGGEAAVGANGSAVPVTDATQEPQAHATTHEAKGRKATSRRSKSRAVSPSEKKPSASEPANAAPASEPDPEPQPKPKKPVARKIDEELKPFGM